MSRVGILKVLQWVLFVVDRIVSAAFGYSLVSGWKKEQRKSKSNYESSAHIFRIGFRAKKWEVEPARLDMFLLLHSRYVHPSYILSHDNITLMGVTKDQAFFAVLPPDVDVYSSELHPFMNVIQFRFATHIIVIPMTSFHVLANEIGDPTSQVLLISSTGRCGSTLLAQMFETGVPKTIVMSEPDAFCLAHREHCLGNTTDEQDGKILRSVIRLQCKTINVKKIDVMVIKTRGVSVQQIKKIHTYCNYVKRIFMYRHPKNTLYSFARALQSFSIALTKGIFSDTIPLPETERYRSIKRTNLLEGLTSLGLLTVKWTMNCICYLEYKHEGIEVYPVRYEDLLKDPQGTASKLFSFLGISEEYLGQALTAMERDSQRGSVIGREMVAKYEIDEFTSEQVKEINFVLQRAGFPSIEEFQDLPHWNELTEPLQLVKAYTSV